MRRPAAMVVIVGACLALATAAAAGLRDNPGGGQAPNAQQQAAIDACKAKGVKPGTDAFQKCLTDQLGANGGGSSKPLTPQQQAAIDACKAKGFAVNSDDFMQCIKEQTSTGPALTDKQQ